MKKKIFLIASLILFATAVYQISFNLASTLKIKNLIDFSVYYQAIERFLQGKNPYQFFYGAPTDKIPFNYPPSSLIALLPWKILPIKTAQVFLIILSFLFFWTTFWLILKTLKIKLSRPHLLILLAFLTQTFPVKFTLVLGQINLIVLGLTFLGLYFYLMKATGGAPNIISITLFSLACALKPFPLLTLPLFFLLRDFKFVFSLLTIFLLLNLAPGISLAKQYFFQILPSITYRLGQPNFYDQSILAFLLRLNIEPSWAKIIAFTIFLLVYLLILVKFWQALFKQSKLARFGRRDRTRQLIYSTTIILSLSSIANIFSWQHHLIFSYPLIFLLYLKTLPKDHLKLRLFHHLVFLLIWALLVFHFKTETSPYLDNPFIASYQTLLILMLVGYSVVKLN